MSEQTNPIISFKNFSFQYRAQKKPTLHDINLDIYPGERVLIAGPSGSGKSTLAACINGLNPFSYPGECTGSLTVDGVDAPNSSIFELSAHVGTVLQDPDGQFIGLTVGEDIAFALENSCVPQKEMHEITRHAAELVGIENRLDHAPHELSGGQKQRVSLAGVMVDQVKILMFDEPLASLDPATGKQAIELIDEIQHKTDTTVLIIEHRLEDVLWRNVDRIILVNEGTILADLRPDELLATHMLAENGIREPLYLTAMRYAGIAITPEKRPAHVDTVVLDDADTARLHKWFHALPLPEPGPAPEHLLEVRGLGFGYTKGQSTLHDISFSIGKGEMVSIVGRNGAGKSTTMNIMTGYIASTSGEVLIDGHNILEEPEAAKKCIGYLPEQPPLYFDMTVAEYLKFAAELKKVPKNERETQIEQVMELTGITAMANRLIKNLSKGYKQRVGLAQAILGYPEIIILDEPTVGLDPKQIIEIRELIRKLSEEHTIILSSHILSEVSAVWDYIMIINHGKLVASVTTENLMNHSLGSNTLELTVKGEKQDVEKMLRDVEEIQKLEWKPGENEKTVSMVITTEEKTDIREKLFYMMAEAKMPILNMQFTKVSLEDIFLELTQNETAPVPDEQDTKPESAPEDETGTDTEKENETEQEAHDESNL